MALEACSECKAEVSTTATVCPKCGAGLPTGEARFRFVDNFMIVAAGVLAIVAYYVYF